MPRPCSKERPDSSGFLRPDDLNRLIRLILGGIAAAGNPFANYNHQNSANYFSGDFNRGGRGAKLVNDEHVGNQHAACNPAQQRRAQRNHDGDAIDKLQHYSTAPDDDRHADDQTDDHVVQLMIQVRVLRRAGNGNDVVQAHHEVGDKYGLDRAHHRAAALDVAMLVLIGNQQLDAYPYQQQGADNLEERNTQQRKCEGDQQNAQNDGAGGTPQDALYPLLVLQVAACQRDNHGVIAAQQDIDEDDLKYSSPMERL